MKKQNLSKFALSLVCAAVLTACGGSSNKAPDTTDTTTPPSAEEALKQKVAALLEAATKANAEAKLGLTEEQLKAFAAQNADKVDPAKAEDLLKAIQEFLAAQTTPPKKNDINDQVDVSVPFTNFQIARNFHSNVGSEDTSKVNSDTISFSRGKVELHPSFDTIVVATPKAGSKVGKTAYLEDFQFNYNDAGAARKGKELVEVLLHDSLGFAELNAYDDATGENTSKITAEGLGGTAGFIGEKVKAAFTAASAEADLGEYKTEFANQLTTAKTALTGAKNNLASISNDANKKAVKLHEAVVAILEEANKAVQAYSGNYDTAKLAKVALAPVVTEVKKGNKYFYVPTEFAFMIANKASDATAAASATADKWLPLFGTNGRTQGKQQLQGLYVDKESTQNSALRTDRQLDTETDTVGADNGTALVYQDGRRIYITADEAKNKDFLKSIIVPQASTLVGGDTRVLESTVAEVYGNKTFTYELFHGDIGRYEMLNDGGVNLPLTQYNAKTGEYSGSLLSRVQYGRVTSALHNVLPDALKPGVDNNLLVASFGTFGTKGTENHYFSRGSDHITAASLKDLGTSGKLNYQGHAVAYGLDNTYDGRDVGAVPNAVGSAYKLYSGNHVQAEIDLGSKKVTGNVFNKWTDLKYNSKGELNMYNVNLVDFRGTLAENGNITGSSNLAYGDKSEGSFSAALYGQKAQELGGAVQSKDYSADKAWGAVFGAVRVDEAKATASPWDPRNEVRK